MSQVRTPMREPSRRRFRLATRDPVLGRDRQSVVRVASQASSSDRDRRVRRVVHPRHDVLTCASSPTNCDLGRRCAQGRSRRLVLPVEHRRTAIAAPAKSARGHSPLAEHFLASYGRRYGRNTLAFGRGGRGPVQPAWPGNVRQLEHSSSGPCCWRKTRRLPRPILDSRRRLRRRATRGDDTRGSRAGAHSPGAGARVGHVTEAAAALGLSRSACIGG